jgi:RHS repeat-associated protein
VKFSSFIRKSVAIAVSLLSFLAVNGQGQVNSTDSTGVEPIYSYKGGLSEAINLYNGNLNASLPLHSLKGRAGQNVNISLTYDSRQFSFSYNEWGNTAEWNHSGNIIGRWMNNIHPAYVTEYAVCDESTCTWKADVVLENGTQLYFQGTPVPPGPKGFGYSRHSTDLQFDFDNHVMRSKDGTWYDFAQSGVTRKGDSNGNYITYNWTNVSGCSPRKRTNSIVDNMGRTVTFTYSTDPPIGSCDQYITPLQMSLPSNSGTLTWTFEYDVVNVNFGYYGYQDSTWVNVYLLRRINLPDGKFWAFTYHAPAPNLPTLLLNQVTYPTGGYTRYNYTGSNVKLDAKLSAKILNANNGLGEITTTYQHSHCYQDAACTNPPASRWAKAIEPDGAYQTSNFTTDNRGLETSHTRHDSAETVLTTIQTTWTDFGSENYRATNIRSLAGTSTVLSDTILVFDGSGNLLSEEIRAPAAALGFRARRTERDYLPFQRYVTRVSEERVYDLDNALSPPTLVSRTYFSFDEAGHLTDRGAVAGHDSVQYGLSFTSRGNATTVNKWLADPPPGRALKILNWWDTVGNVIKTRDARNNETNITFSAAFHYAYPTVVTNPENHTVTTDYWPNTGLVKTVTDANSKTRTNTYDNALNRLTRVDFPDGGYKRFTYDLTLNNFSTTVFQAITATQESSTTTYLDGIGREKQKKTTDPGGDIYVDTVYSICDCSGKVAKVSNPYRLGETVYWSERRYDALGRLTKVIPPDGTATTNHVAYSYDTANSTTTVTDPAGKSRRYHNDVIGRIWKIVEPDSAGQLTQETTYNYLPTVGQNKLLITQGAQTRTFNHDTLGRLLSDLHPENGTTSYSYDDNGNMTSRTDARGWVTNLTYDRLNRLTGKTYLNDGGVTPPVTLTYDNAPANGIGRLATWTSGTHSGTKSYDSMGRVTVETRNINSSNYSAQWSYNLAGQVLTTTYPNGWTTSNNYDGVGNLENISSSFTGSIVSNVDRNAAGQPTLVAYGNGVNNTRTYNSGLQLSNLRVYGPGGDYLNKTYNYNAGTANNGRIISVTDNLDANNTVSYTYDSLNRLTTAQTAGPAWGLSWTYDRYGNRTEQISTKGSPPTNSLSVNITTNRVNGWGHDLTGNVQTDGRNSYSYDAENRVLSINGGASTYGYDAFGGRVQKTSGGTTTKYFFGLAEHVNGAWTKILVGTPAGVIEWDNGTMLYKSSDHRGDPRVITNSSGFVSGRLDLYPYGEIWSETGSTTKFKLTSKERDSESGNDYFGARQYWNGAARWLAVDPNRSQGYNPQTLNRYTYVSNDPVNLVDPDGREEIPAGCVAIKGLWHVGFGGDPVWVVIAYFCGLVAKPPVPAMGPGTTTALQAAQGPSPDKILEAMIEGINKGEQEKMKKVLEDLPQSCKDFFSADLQAMSDMVPNVKFYYAYIKAIGDKTRYSIGYRGLDADKTLSSRFDESPTAWAYALWDENMRAIVFGLKFFLDFNNPDGRDILRFHEFLHAFYKKDDIDLAKDLKLGEFKTSGEASAAIGKFITNECKK